ncbi:SRPBCC family protein [Microbacterium sp. RD1]|uniref:SRPBCC family protein n=1 Tax=Microbacterium sp. RD1 TaxID=3457313 RepID=UPI003FA5595F
MSRNTRELRCTPSDVFRVLENGWLFPSWVVGASRMRDVAPDWPAVGSRLHHSFGTWPVLIDDSTEVLDYDPPRRLVLKARGWPIGEARVTIDVKPRGDGSVVRIQEEAISGPGALIPQPLLDVPLSWRNAETLHRLAYLAEGIADSGERRTTAEDEDPAARADPDTSSAA